MDLLPFEAEISNESNQKNVQNIQSISVYNGSKSFIVKRIYKLRIKKNLKIIKDRANFINKNYNKAYY